MINLAIVSDIRLYREGLGRILNEIDEINVVSVIDSHEKILKLLGINHLDVVLLDMRMPDSRAVVASITDTYQNIKIIVIAVPENDENYLLCVESGIAGYLSKESTVEELIDAVKTVGAGSMYCPCTITQYLLMSVKHKYYDTKIYDSRSVYSSSLDVLTQRETQIVKLLVEGMSNKKIAKTLTIELSTVKNHIHNILVKMGVESRVQVVCMMREQILS